MKKDTKKLLLVGFLALTMFFSSIAWIIFSVPFGQPQTEGEVNIPDNLIVDGYVSNATAIPLLQRGYSVMEFHYYSGCCPDLISFVDALPADLEYQIIVQKITDSNSTWAYVRSLRGEKEWNITTVSDLLPSLCEILLKPPLECGLMQFVNSTNVVQ